MSCAPALCCACLAGAPWSAAAYLFFTTTNYYTNMNTNKQEGMALTLGGLVQIPIQVWDAKSQSWFKSESDTPLRDHLKAEPVHHRTVLEQAPKGGWRSVRIEVEEEQPVFRSISAIIQMLEQAPELILGLEDAEMGKVVPLLDWQVVQEEIPAYIPRISGEDTREYGPEEGAAYRNWVSHRPEVRDFPWHAEQYWNLYLGGDTQILLPGKADAVRADSLEYPQCAPCRDDFLTMEQERIYAYSEMTNAGPCMLEYRPRLYRLTTEQPCIVKIIAGMREEPLMLAVRGQETYEDSRTDKAE